MNLYVSNLAYALTDEELRSAFAAYGTVASARVVLDRETGRSRGFGFVDMPDDNEGTTALNALNGMDLNGRPLKVVVARPKEDRPGGFSGAPRSGGAGAPRRDFGGGGGGGGGRDWDDSGGNRGGGGGRRGGGGGREKDRGWERDRRGGRGNSYGDDDGGW